MQPNGATRPFKSLSLSGFCMTHPPTVYALTVTLWLQFDGDFLFCIGCTGNQPLVSGLHFSVLDYQMWSNSNDSTSYDSGIFGEEPGTAEMLISYEGRIGADYYRGWCSELNPTEQPFLQIDFKREVIIRQVEIKGLLISGTARYIRGFWLAYSTSTSMVFINVTEPNTNLTKVSIV